jgi:hypothetical protein
VELATALIKVAVRQIREPILQGRLSTVDLLACLVKKNIFSVLTAADLNTLVQGGQLYLLSFHFSKDSSGRLF